MAGKKGQKKRFWADEEKSSICAQALAPGVSVAQVARRYSMNANLIFKWLKPKFINKIDKCLISFRPNGRKCYNTSVVRLVLAG